MKQITLQIPDKEYDFFMNLLRKIGFVKIKDADYMVPERHKDLVRERISSAKKLEFIEWDEA